LFGFDFFSAALLFPFSLLPAYLLACLLTERKEERKNGLIFVVSELIHFISYYSISSAPFLETFARSDGHRGGRILNKLGWFGCLSFSSRFCVFISCFSALDFFLCWRGFCFALGCLIGLCFSLELGCGWV
jgi:hypothetical protein